MLGGSQSTDGFDRIERIEQRSSVLGQDNAWQAGRSLLRLAVPSAMPSASPTFPATTEAEAHESGIGPTDPAEVRWAECELPDAWPDQIAVGRPRILWRLLKALFGRKRPLVELPEGLPGADGIPKYVLQEFHGLPNGNYSKRVTAGYSRWFDRAMLGVMTTRRQRVADALKSCGSVLDIGTGGGQLAGLIKSEGVEDVWGLDPSPYLLQHAHRAFPDVHFVQGVAEDMSFSDNRFDGISACFLFHELPPKFAARALQECRRVLRPGGKLYIVEPGAEQSLGRTWDLIKRYGWRGLYFRLLARRVHEPFVPSFHRRDKVALLAEHGFELEVHASDFPTEEWCAVAA